MSLSSDLISQFAKLANNNETKPTESTSFGTIVEYEGSKYVKLDGSELLTPMNTTADTDAGDRVTVLIKDHTATVTGNLSSPSARSETVKELGSKISEFEIIVAYKVTTEDLEAINATIESLRAKIAKFDNIEAAEAEIVKLKAKFAELDHITAKDIEAITADIESIRATFGTFTDISTEDLEALNAEIATLHGYTADFTYVSAEVLSAMKASIKKLDTGKLSAKDAEINYANIDFANIGEAAIKKIFSDYGLIKDLVVGDGTITGELVGVTIKGDLIEGNTVKADKLVVKGSDGLYYKLNFEGGTFKDGEVVPADSLHGSVITAKSITAEKVSVKDLVAFGATIGGFHITESSLYSGSKKTVGNTTRGIYQDNTGQFAVGDASNFLKFYRDGDGNYKLAISADSILLSTGDKKIDLSEQKIGARNLIRNSKSLVFDDYYFVDDSGRCVLGSGTLGSMILGKES